MILGALMRIWLLGYQEGERHFSPLFGRLAVGGPARGDPDQQTRARSLEFRVQGLGLRVEGLGFRV